MNPQATRPERVNPFASTAHSHGHVAAVLERARRRKAAEPRPSAYWESPVVHGSGRQIDLHRHPLGAVPRARKHHETTGRLPIPPRSHSNTGAVVGLVVVGGGALLAWYLWHRSKQKPAAHIGDDGLSLLGAD